ncbi:MAG: hypothetical protein ACLUE2_08095 [Bacteroides cellulosilyticus]
MLGQTYAYYGNVINSTFGYFALLAESFTYPCGESALLFSAFTVASPSLASSAGTKWLAMLDALTAFSNSAIRVFISAES